MEVKESTVYENLLGVKEGPKKADLSEFFDIEETEDPMEPKWKKHWVGMPEFQQDTKAPYKQIYLNFRTKEDYEEFAKLVDQNLTDKTKSIWYPKLEKDQNALKRWIEE
jgi:hypothetical protein